MNSFSKKRILEILDQAQEGDSFSKFIDRLLGGLIVLNILAVSLESIEYLGVKYRQEFLYFEYLSIIIFGNKEINLVSPNFLLKVSSVILYLRKNKF